MNKMVLIAAVIGVLAIGGRAAVYFTSMAPSGPQAPVADTRAFASVEVPTVVANFGFQGGMRYLQVTVNLQPRDSDSAKPMDENAPLIQGEMLMLMQDLDFEIVRTVDGKRAFIKQVDASIRALFDNPEDPFELEKVILTGFVV